MTFSEQDALRIAAEVKLYEGEWSAESLSRALNLAAAEAFELAADACRDVEREATSWDLRVRAKQYRAAAQEAK